MRETENHGEKGGLRGRWTSCPLSLKVRFISGVVTAVVALSVCVCLLVSGFGMLEFGSMLRDTSRSLAFWSAVEAESRIFNSYAEDRSPENREAWEAACLETKRALDALPYDYQSMGVQRFAKTWSIHNSYETYAYRRDRLLSAPVGDEDYWKALYQINRMQEYIKAYAGSLEQMNVEAGALRYRSCLPFLLLFPFAAVLLGAAAVAVITWMKRSAERAFIRPVLDLAGESRRIAANDFSGPDLRADGADEIGELIAAFQKMKRATGGYIAALKEKHEAERRLDDVRLQMLKSQINPHFLFNTLNMIASMAQIEEAQTTEKMITAMSSLFRYNLKSTGSVMPLEREVKVVQDYMYLQQMRFGDRVSYSVDCAPDTLEELVPSFALQPLVENAIVHGLADKLAGGRIHIRSRLKEGRLWIFVADTGMGIPEGRLTELRRSLKREKMGEKREGAETGSEVGTETGTGIGLGNICRRVHAMYPDGEMRLYSQAGYGTVVVLAFTAG